MLVQAEQLRFRRCDFDSDPSTIRHCSPDQTRDTNAPFNNSVKQQVSRQRLSESQINMVVYPVPETSTRSPRIAYRQSAINSSLAPKPTPKHSPNPTLNLALALALTLTLTLT